MTKRMLIDASHAEETRVVVVDGSRIEELDFESSSRKQLRGNIYLAKVTRVEPSLQAAFIEYGGNRHGFLAFNEIHPDYYQIPVADREALMREVDSDHSDDDEDEEDGEEAEDEGEEAFMRRQRRLMRRYKIQEVIRRRQIMLVQVVKEERGNKGAALTTYLSLAGRYGVLMPNTGRGGGISRKIVSSTDRRRLKTIVQSLDVPTGMGLIVRTAGAKRTKNEINRDYDYLLRLWENIRETTLKSVAPSLIYEEEDLVKRAIRDMYDKDLEGIVVEGEHGYREARQFMRMIMPGQSSKITPYREKTPLFTAFKIEDQLAQIHSPTVPLKSGGYLVINQTEALVAVDVNSGRSTKERNVENTAFRTNLEAAEETARQLRLRDLAGLIVIDFIDMDESKNNRAVEKVLKDCLSTDRARVQMGKISPFGLMEISRQRRRTGVLEGATHVCEHCQGMGRVRNVESSALAALRAIEMEAVRGGSGSVLVRLPTAVALYVLNEKRNYVSRLEQIHLLEVNIVTDDAAARDDIEIERTASHGADEEGAAARFIARRLAPPLAPSVIEDDEEEDVADFEDDVEDEDEEPVLEEAGETEDIEPVEAREDEGGRGRDRGDRDRGGRQRRRRRGGRRDEAETVEVVEVVESEGDEDAEPELVSGEAGDDAEARHRRRRRGRRGGRRLREEGRPADPYAWVHAHERATPHPSEDPYAWRDPHAPEARPEERAYAREVETDLAPPSLQPTRPDAGAQGQTEADAYVWTDPDAVPGGEPPTGDTKEPRTRGRRHRGGRGRGRDRGGRGRDEETPRDQDDQAVAADSEIALADVAELEPVEGDAAVDAGGVDTVMDAVVADAPSATVEPQPMDEPAVAEAPLAESQAAPEPIEQEAPAAEATVAIEPVEAEPVIEPEAVEPPPPPEPDPAEITGQAAAPRRGWWRRRG